MDRESLIHLLKTDVKKFNEVRPILLNLQGVKLRGVDLYGVDLYGVNLQGANLQGADLRKSNLELAKLDGADLRKSNLRKSNLYGADLCGARLQGARLQGADLKGANLKGADLLNTCVFALYLGEYFAYYVPHQKYLQIGCRGMTYKEWVEEGEKIAEANVFSKKDYNLYKDIIERIVKG